jgi:hypothetical protein
MKMETLEILTNFFPAVNPEAQFKYLGDWKFFVNEGLEVKGRPNKRQCLQSLGSKCELMADL